MAYLTKEQYNYRRESAAQRMADNAEIETLTPEQHETLAYICKMRHELHCNPTGIFYTGGADYDRLVELVSDYTGTENNFMRIASEAGLPPLHIELYDEYDNDSAGEWDEDFKIDEAEQECIAYVERLNTTIETWLRAIDEEHGTNYAPTGALRV
jgi:hypothetical protein